MPRQRKPEEMVSILLARLDQARTSVRSIHYNNEGVDDEIDAGFNNIKTDLDKMENYFSSIKYWEGKLMKQFSTLEENIADDDFFRGLDPDRDDKIINALKRIRDSVESIKQLFPAEESTRILTHSTSFTERHLPLKEAVGKDQTWSEEWSSLGVEERIDDSKVIPNLQKSFDCLESYQLKACSLCLSIFPKNSIIKKRPLIYWWIGERMVTKTSEKTVEEVGEDVFKELISESFIIPTYENSSPNVYSFMVHPWIRRMLITVAKRLSFFEFTSLGMPINGHRRAFLLPGGGHSYSSISEDTLTVFIVNDQYLAFKPDWLSRLNRVEVLQLGRWQDSVVYHIEVKNEDLTVESKKKKTLEYEVSLDGLGSQRCLRYLSLRGVSRLSNLPLSVLKLIRLEILDLRACHGLEKLPFDISALRHLTHLDVSECYLLESMPKGTEELSALQVLEGFLIRKVGNLCKS